MNFNDPITITINKYLRFAIHIIMLTIIQVLMLGSLFIFRLAINFITS